MQKLFKGGNYSRAETIRGNMVSSKNGVRHFLPLTEAYFRKPKGQLSECMVPIMILVPKKMTSN